MTRYSSVFGIGLARMAFLCACLPPCGLAWPQDADPPTPVAEFRFIDDGRLITVPVTFASDSYLFTVDSGSSCNFWDVAFEQHFGKAVREEVVNKGSQNETRLKRFQPPSAFLLNRPLPTGRYILTSDFKNLREVTGDDVRGLLGMPLFLDWVVQYDFDDGVLRLFPPDCAHSGWGEKISLRLARGAGYVDDIIIAGTQHTLTLDTGSNCGILVEPSIYDQLERDGALKSLRQGLRLEISGVNPLRTGRLAAPVSLGSFSHDELLISAGSSSSLGLEYLRRFVVTIDVDNSSLYLRKGRNYSFREYPEMSGIHMRLIDGRVIASAVDPGSPAARAGVCAGDALLQIDGTPIAAHSLVQIRNTLQDSPGRSVRLSVDRNGKQFEFTFQLSESF